MVKLPSSVSRRRGRGKTPLALRPAVCPCSVPLPAALTAPRPLQNQHPCPSKSPIALGPFPARSPAQVPGLQPHPHCGALSSPLLSFPFLPHLFLSPPPLYLSPLLSFCFVLSSLCLIYLCFSGHPFCSVVGVSFCLASGSQSCELRCVCWCALSSYCRSFSPLCFVVLSMVFVCAKL